MFRSRLRKLDAEYIVVVPSGEVERLGLREGQLISLEIQSVSVQPTEGADRTPIVPGGAEGGPDGRS